MKRINDLQELEVCCNKCGRPIIVENNIIKEGLLEVQADWGYFSLRDLEVHKFDVCESCYEEWVKTFKVPIDIVSKIEML